MDQNGKIRGWTWVGLAVAALTVAAPRAARADSRGSVSDGVCHESPQEALAALAEDIAAARVAAEAAADEATCVPVGSAFREHEEQRELQQIAADVTKAVDARCAKQQCVSNLALPVCKLDPWGPPCFGGCNAFSELADDTIGMPRYFSKQRVHQCGPVFCHWVVVLTNDRTGDEVVIDAWKRGGGAAMRGSRSTSVLDSIRAYRDAYPDEPILLGSSDPKRTGFCKTNFHPTTNEVTP